MNKNKRGELVNGPGSIINQTGENEEFEEERVEPNLRLNDIAEIGFQNMEKGTRKNQKNKMPIRTSTRKEKDSTQ